MSNPNSLALALATLALATLDDMFPLFSSNDINKHILQITTDFEEAKEIAKKFFLVLQLIGDGFIGSVNDFLADLVKGKYKKIDDYEITDYEIFVDSALHDMFNIYISRKEIEERLDPHSISNVSELFEELLIKKISN
jgi:hypothetical protein